MTSHPKYKILKVRFLFQNYYLYSHENRIRLLDYYKSRGSSCHLENELKTIQNTFLALGYPGGLISKVITKAKSSSALKIIGPQKYPVYLKLPFLGKVSENFANRIFEEVSQVLGSARLRTVL